MHCLGRFTWGCDVRQRSWGSFWRERCLRFNHTFVIPTSGRNLLYGFANCRFLPLVGMTNSKILDETKNMAIFGLIEYDQATLEVRAIYDDIMATRKTDYITNFWKAIAHDPPTLKRTWESIKQVMAPGALDAVTKEMIYVAVSVTNQCEYCIATHTASARDKGLTDTQFKELMAVVGMASETNRLVKGYQVEIDERFKT